MKPAELAGQPLVTVVTPVYAGAAYKVMPATPAANSDRDSSQKAATSEDPNAG